MPFERSANNGSWEWCRRLANADALKRHERVNAFNLVLDEQRNKIAKICIVDETYELQKFKLWLKVVN